MTDTQYSSYIFTYFPSLLQRHMQVILFLLAYIVLTFSISTNIQPCVPSLFAHFAAL